MYTLIRNQTALIIFAIGSLFLANSSLGQAEKEAAANGTNMICIVIPCHRVIRADGTLCGYGGGLWRKKWLLDHERKSASKRL